MNEYAMYLRKSRADIELEAMTKEDTLRRHKNILEELAKKQSLKVTAVYEEVVSGESIADRPEMKRLLADIYQRRFRGVLVVEVERLARGDTKDQGTVAEAFKYTDTLIITPAKTYDPNNEFDEEYFEFGLFMSRREYKTISRRMERGKISSVKEGNYIASTRPYGYEIIRPAKKTRTLKELPEESVYVRQIFKWFVEDNLSAGEIARTLTRMGIKTYNGKDEWNHGTIVEMLKNPVYVGIVRWKYRPIIKAFDEDGQIKERRARVSSEEMISATGKHVPLISMELFEAAQKRFEEEPNRVPLSKNLINPFAGLVFCKKCGRSFFYHDNKKSEGTRIRMTHRVSQICHVKSCFYDDFRDTVLKSLQKDLEDFKIKLNNNDETEHIREHEQMITAMEKEISEINIRRAKLFDLLERGVYSENDFIERKNTLNHQLSKTEKELKNLLDTKPIQVDYEEKVYLFSQTIAALSDDTIPAKEKNKLLKSIIRRIEFSRENDDEFILDIFLL